MPALSEQIGQTAEECLLKIVSPLRGPPRAQLGFVLAGNVRNNRQDTQHATQRLAEVCCGGCGGGTVILRRCVAEVLRTPHCFVWLNCLYFTFHFFVCVCVFFFVWCMLRREGAACGVADAGPRSRVCCRTLPFETVPPAFQHGLARTDVIDVTVCFARSGS